MMHHIRPYKIFTLIDSPPGQRIVNVTIPSRRGTGGTSLLETLLIITGSRIVEAHRAFDIGTYLGSNTFNLALNMPADAEIFTLDLDEQAAAEMEQHPADAPLTQTHLAVRDLDFVGSPVAERIRTLAGNSMTFDFSSWKQAIDFVFIDGGHDFLTVKADTENALAMAAREKPSCIMWHDYRNVEYRDLTNYLEGLSERLEIFHVEDTMLCAWFNDPSGSIVPRLLK